VGSGVTDLQREKIVERMFPDWREHLSDGKVIDHILEQLARYQVLFKKCSTPGCKQGLCSDRSRDSSVSGWVIQFDEYAKLFCR
jgi:hypothetical protein